MRRSALRNKSTPNLTTIQQIDEASRTSPQLREALSQILLPRHPSQIYEAILEGAFLFAMLWLLRTKVRLPNGVLTGVFFIAYAGLRILAECFREPDAPLTGPFTRGQFLSLFLSSRGHWFLRLRLDEAFLGSKMANVRRSNSAVVSDAKFVTESRNLSWLTSFLCRAGSWERKNYECSRILAHKKSIPATRANENVASEPRRSGCTQRPSPVGIVLTASRSEPIREPQENLFVDCIQHLHHSALNRSYLPGLLRRAGRFSDLQTQVRTGAGGRTHRGS